MSSPGSARASTIANCAAAVEGPTDDECCSLQPGHQRAGAPARRSGGLMRRSRRPRRTAALCRAMQGNAAVEIALLSPVLVIMLTGTIQLGLGFYKAMQVQQAAEAGAMYAANNGTASLAGIEAAVTSASSTLGITATPIPVLFCGCPTTTGVISQASCTTPLCASSAAPGHYVTVSATITLTNLISSSYLNLSLPKTLTRTSVIRTQ
jgi:Flp pilus assembly protein TadG